MNVQSVKRLPPLKLVIVIFMIMYNIFSSAFFVFCLLLFYLQVFKWPRHFLDIQNVFVVLIFLCGHL